MRGGVEAETPGKEMRGPDLRGGVRLKKHEN